MVSLGCPKNLVDGEVMLGSLRARGHELVADPREADVLVVNTCAFIDRAKQESIDAVLEMAKQKEDGRARRLVVTGCLAQRYDAELRREIPEIDASLGTGQVEGIVRAVEGQATSLSEAAGPPIYLFKASDAPWLQEQQKISNKQRTYVTDGPEFYRTKTGRLLMIWSSYRDGLYVETLAHSESGTLRGPWKQDEPLVGEDSGHGMIFTAFDGRLMLILHQPFNRAKGKLFELEDTGDSVRIKRQLVW